MGRRKLRNYRYDISNKEILEKLEQGWTIAQVKGFYGCSRSLVKSIQRGTRPEPQKKKVKGKVCSCCGLQPVADGLHFLCDSCYRKRECGSFDEHTIGSYR